MALKGKFIWIWELSRCDNGDINKIIQKAKDTGVDGYILKAHDGASFWHQTHSIQEFKKAGLKCGAWGYCYGNNIAGEIKAIKETLLYGPDFYIFNVEKEFESESMRGAAEQLVSGIMSSSVPLGYTSFAIPGYHSIPYDVFSKYCDFTMPQVYWFDMGWDVKKAFDTSLKGYENYKIPVYPIGQIANNVPAEQIQEFEKLCLEEGIQAFSYWNYQDASTVQFNAVKESDYALLVDALGVLHDSGVIKSPEYWLENAEKGKTVKGEFAALLIMRMADKIKGQL